MSDPLTSATAVTSTDPKRLLVDWANKQDGWVRRGVARIIATRRPTNADDIDDLFEAFLAEKGFGDSQTPEEPTLTYAVDVASSAATLRLNVLREVVGVNALTTGYKIEFSPGLTILYGENGTGKTGYARVLKRLAGVRQAEDIIENINVTSPPLPQATIDYTLGADSRSLAWTNSLGVPPFTRMSIFDSPAVNLHVDENLSYIYTPADLSLFSYVTDSIRAVQAALTSQVRELTGGGNPFLRHFQRGTNVYTAIETLGASTDIGSLRTAAVVPAGAIDEKAALEQEVAALSTNVAEGLLAGHKEAVRTLESLTELATAVAKFNPDTYNEQLAALTAVQETYRQVREGMFLPNELPGEADDFWQAFVSSANTYKAHLDLHDYPDVGDQCIYCRQPLRPDAISLIRKYSTFLDDALARQVDVQLNSLTVTTASILSVRTASFRDAIRRQREAGSDDEIYTVSDSLLDRIDTIQQSVPSRARVDGEGYAEQVRLLQVGLCAPLQSHRAAATELAEQLANRLAALEESRKKLARLTAQMDLQRHLPEIETYVERAKRAARMKKLLERFATTLRSLTEVSKIASEELINHDFERLFREECDALRTPKVELEFVGREGKAHRRKSLASRYRLSQILSEGEQKVLALADFIAEARLGDSSAPIVFDDPVNSLDHRRLQEVASRIGSLVETRQVIVFTHNIWLATELLDRFEKRPNDCSYFSVTDDETTGAKGRVDRAGGPRWDTEKELTKRINELLDHAASASGEAQIALVESAFGMMRSWCEVVVEQVLFGSVTQRYRSNIMMGRLSEVRAERLPAAIAAVTDVFERACRYMPDHSQPLVRLGTRPSLADAQADWQRLRDALKAYRAQ